MKKVILIDGKEAAMATAKVLDTLYSLNSWLNRFNKNMGKQDLGLSEIDPMDLYSSFEKNRDRLNDVLAVLQDEE